MPTIYGYINHMQQNGRIDFNRGVMAWLTDCDVSAK